MRNKLWLLYAMLNMILWGIWGAFIEIPEKAGFPATLGYSAWAMTMIPVTFIALKLNNWKLDHDRRSIIYGMSAGLLGSGGQLILFQCLRMGPAYIVFPIISLYPIVTIFFSVAFLKERANRRSWIGIILALIAILLLSYRQSQSTIKGYLWLLLAIVVFLMWGLQAFIMKLGSDCKKEINMQAESVTFYLMVSSVMLIPVAFFMTDFSQNINWRFNGVYTAFIVQSLNAVGFLFFAYALRNGKAIIVLPMMSLAPVITVILSLVIYSVVPHPVIITGMIIAFISIYLLC
jgi:drug/metabolite transporter (DMT)-like permease